MRHTSTLRGTPPAFPNYRNTPGYQVCRCHSAPAHKLTSRQQAIGNDAACPFGFAFESLWIVIKCEEDGIVTQNMQHMMPTRAA